MLRSVHLLVRDIRADEMRQNLAEDMLGVHHYVHVSLSFDTSAAVEGEARCVRYGLSITFFIIIGDQLDRCRTMLATGVLHSAALFSSDFRRWYRLLLALVSRPAAHDHRHIDRVDLSSVLLQNDQVSADTKVTANKPHVPLTSHSACSVFWPSSTW